MNNDVRPGCLIYELISDLTHVSFVIHTQGASDSCTMLSISSEGRPYLVDNVTLKDCDQNCGLPTPGQNQNTIVD